MYIKLDKNAMEVTAVCGILETYSPTEEVQTIEARVKALREKMDKFMKKLVEPELAEIQRMIDAENAKYVVRE